ncbi:MAG: hypothetical protein U9R74_18465, partial [Pseudomonadota bacterium]|nr:hypothetical protein [Pseudomonadota bacterium]
GQTDTGEIRAGHVELTTGPKAGADRRIRANQQDQQNDNNGVCFDHRRTPRFAFDFPWLWR